MSTRPQVPPLPPFQQAALAKALPLSGAPGVLYNTVLPLDGRSLAVAAGRPVRMGDWDAELTKVVERRSKARVSRLLPVVATGCHNGWHWVAYEAGRAQPLVGEGWRRWPAPLALNLLADVASALDDAAAFGVVPYELSPASVFIDPRAGAVLADFGAPREVFGTLMVDEYGDPFTPPEVVEGGTAGARSGAYVCGALFYALLAGGPPTGDPLTRWRNDLPNGIDLVVSRAMARDTLQRYRTADEFVDSARRALGIERSAEEPREDEEEEPAGPVTSRATSLLQPDPVFVQPDPVVVQPDPVFVQPEPVSEEPEPEPDPEPPRDAEPKPMFELRAAPPPDLGDEPDEYEWRPLVPRWLGPLVIGLAVVAAAVAGVVGFGAGRPEPPASQTGPELAAAGMRVTLPAGWVGGAERKGVVLAAYPNSDWFAGLEIRRLPSGSTTAKGEDPVRIGSLDMWRDVSATPGAVRYTLPTSRGALSISCEGTPATLAQCERSISTLRLDSARALPLAGVTPKPGLRAALSRYSRERARGRAALARARTPKAQRSAAAALAQSGRRAARRLSGFEDADRVADAVSGTASAYTALAGAATSGKKARWHEAVERVRRAESALAVQLRRQR